MYFTRSVFITSGSGQLLCGCGFCTQCKGDYGMEVTKLARPLPLEYLIVELTTTTPLRPKPSLPGGRGAPFPVENRETIGESQVMREITIDILTVSL